MIPSWRAGRDRELRADAFVTFALTPDGGIDTVKMRAVHPTLTSATTFTTCYFAAFDKA